MRISDWSSDVCSSDLYGSLCRGGDLGDGVPAGTYAHSPVGQSDFAAGGAWAIGSDSFCCRLSARLASEARSAVVARRMSGIDCCEIGRANVCNPVTNAHLVCRLLLEKEKHKYYKLLLNE